MVDNIFIERVERFNEGSEQRLQEEFFGKEKQEQELCWETYSVKQLQLLLSVTDDEARLLKIC